MVPARHVRSRFEKIDRLGWAGGIAFAAYGVRIGVRANQADVLTRLEEAFPPGWKRVRSPVVEHLYSLRVGGGDANAPKSTIRRFNLLYSDAVRVARSMNLDEVIRALQSDLQLFVATEAPSWLFVHAGVVEWRGRAILVPGTSFSGKTTVVAAMVRAGASYYSDEYAVLDSRGRVHPYARPLLVREGDAGLPRQVRVEEIGGRAGHKPLPIGLVVDSPYKPGSTWRPQLLSPGRGVMALLAHTVPARLRPQFALATLKSAVHHVPVLKGPRGEAEDVAASVLRELENRAA